MSSRTGTISLQASGKFLMLDKCLESYSEIVGQKPSFEEKTRFLFAFCTFFDMNQSFTDSAVSKCRFKLSSI